MQKSTPTKTEKVQIWVTATQKNQLKRLAEMSEKSLSEYVLNCSLSTNLDTAKMEFYQSINNDLLHLKKFQYVMTRLLLFVLNEHLKSEENTMKIFEECQQDADEKFGFGGE